MRILWLTVDRSHRIAHHFDDFRETVMKFADVTVLKKYPAGDKGQNMWQLSQKLLGGPYHMEEKISSQVLVAILIKSNIVSLVLMDCGFYESGQTPVLINNYPVGGSDPICNIVST